MFKVQVMIIRLLLILAISISPAFASIGKVIEQTGNSVTIKKKSGGDVPSKLNIDVDSYDTIITGKDRARINFADNTKVQVTENSRLVLDEFVYDPKNSDASKIGMKVLTGTVRYASGQIAKQNQQKVNIQTPTATVAVRGTDFSMTVDELGRSMIILLPSCNDMGQCYTGAIDITTMAGTVSITEAFVASFVMSSQSLPTEPTKLNIGIDEINNDLLFKKDDEKFKTTQRRVVTTIDVPDSIAALLAQMDAEQNGRDEPVTKIVASPKEPEKLVTSSRVKYEAPWYIYQTEVPNQSTVVVRTQNNTVLNIQLNDAETTEVIGDQSGSRITIRQKQQ